MSPTPVFTLLVCTLIVFMVCRLGDGATVHPDSPPAAVTGAARQVFVAESDASSFFWRRGRRSTRYYELQAEQRVKLAMTERWREDNEEQRDEYERYAEEDRDEQNERTREKHEQIREYHYDGLYPRYHWFH